VYSPKLNNLKLTSLLILLGMDPDNILPNNCNSSRWIRSPIALGILPDRPHLHIHNLLRVDIVHSGIGIDPVNVGIVANSIIRNCVK